MHTKDAELGKFYFRRIAIASAEKRGVQVSQLQGWRWTAASTALPTLQCCCTDAAEPLHRRCRAVTPALQRCCTGAAELLPLHAKCTCADPKVHSNPRRILGNAESGTPQARESQSLAQIWTLLTAESWFHGCCHLLADRRGGLGLRAIISESRLTRKR